MRVCSGYSLAHNNGFGKLSIVGEITGGVHNKWKQKQEWYKNAGDADSPSLFNHFEYADATSWEWIRWQEKSVALVWHTKHAVYRRKEKADVRDDPMVGLQ